MKSHKQMKGIIESNKELRTKAIKNEKHALHLSRLLESVGQVSLLMSFKLADLVNIALQEGTYFKTKEWCDKHSGKLLVEHNQEDWQRQFFEAYKELRTLEKGESASKIKMKSQSEKFEPLV